MVHSSRRSRPRFLAILLIASGTFALGCDISRSTRSTLPEEIPRTFEGTGPDGLKQKLFITPPSGTPDDPVRLLEVESTITNTGALTVPLITRSCSLLPADLISADGIIFIPVDQPDCEARSADTLSLAPGASTTTVSGVFRIEGTPAGIYSVDVRQAIKPGFFTRFRFRLPAGSGS